ncbi:hypothetical protein PGTUg99_022473 [Puccinia graminis f. sp. tritici]|uniref:Uncharacterized protein n=1 Tax=Puccinia graminis f. sp. tritici TaxID=56615 RepID=A0A5B0Q1G0_PUCGR|nr:hypothetical protein PGTUg99_022473 [Puccinia graminis f. sp. tritici]
MKKPQGKAQRENVETPCDLSVNINSESASLNHRSTYSYVKPNHISTTSANLTNPHSLRYKKASIFSLLPTHRQLLIHQLASDSSHPPTHQRLIFKISTNSSSLRYRPQSITPNSSFFDLVKELLTHPDPLEGSPQSTIPSTNCLPPGTIGVPHLVPRAGIEPATSRFTVSSYLVFFQATGALTLRISSVWLSRRVQTCRADPWLLAEIKIVKIGPAVQKLSPLKVGPRFSLDYLRSKIRPRIPKLSHLQLNIPNLFIPIFDVEYLVTNPFLSIVIADKVLALDHSFHLSPQLRQSDFSFKSYSTSKSTLD